MPYQTLYYKKFIQTVRKINCQFNFLLSVSLFYFSRKVRILSSYFGEAIPSNKFSLNVRVRMDDYDAENHIHLFFFSLKNILNYSILYQMLQIWKKKLFNKTSLNIFQNPVILIQKPLNISHPVCDTERLIVFADILFAVAALHR